MLVSLSSQSLPGTVMMQQEMAEEEINGAMNHSLHPTPSAVGPIQTVQWHSSSGAYNIWPVPSGGSLDNS